MSPEIVTFADSVLFCLIVIALIFICSRLLDSRRTTDRVIFGGILALMLSNYVYYRFHASLPEFQWSAHSLWPRIYLGFETIVILYTILSVFFFFRRTDHTAAADASERRLSEMPAGEAPGVDVFICTYNEDLVILERTILAATAIDYPNFTVWVLDDGRRDWLKRYCAGAGVRYVTRDDNKGAKGGNINNGIRVSGLETNAPFILILDADFCPQRKILKRIVGQFDDPAIGLIQTPQFYYNADPVQHNLLAAHAWVDDQRIFFDIMQPSKDGWGAAFCVGTSCVVRRDALKLISGMPQETVTEDIHLTYRLMQKGLRTRWLNERLSVGLSAESLSAYITQRCRWCLGTIQVALLSDGPFFGRGYTMLQRLHYLHGLLFWFCRPFVLMMMVAPILYYFLGLPALLMEPAAFFMYALPMVAGMWVFHSWVSGNRSLPLFTEVSQIVSAVPITFAIIHALWHPFGRPFKVTAKGEDRSQVQVLYQLAAPFLAIIVLTLIGMANGPLLNTYSGLDMFSVAWGIVVMIYAFVAMIICVELPRRPAEDVRFHPNLIVPMALQGVRSSCLVREISSGHAEIVPEKAVLDTLRPGDDILFRPMERLAAIGRVRRIDAGQGTAELDIVAVKEMGMARRVVSAAGKVREMMTAHLFSDTPTNIASKAKPRAAVSALSRRIFATPHTYLEPLA